MMGYFRSVKGDGARWRANFHPPVTSSALTDPSPPPEVPTVRSVPAMSLLERTMYAAIVAVGLALTISFGYVWFNPSNIPHSFSGYHHSIDILLFEGVSWVVWQQILMQLFLWFVAFSIKRPLPMTPKDNYRVAFITTFVPQSESISLLHNILPAMVAVEYPHDSWLLDEGGSDEVRQLCTFYGVRYFTRHGVAKYNTESGSFARTKGGNHNAWYDTHADEYDIVAQMDTDFIPEPHFLRKTLGYFNDPKVAFVGTPQVYGNATDSKVARGAAQQQYGFYGPVMQGMSGADTALMIGANHIVRVAALKDIGFYAGHLTEDLLTGMTLHTKGWKSIYVPEILAVGEGPATWEAYFTQQMRWAFGCMDILFLHSPRLFPRMGPRRLLRYLVLQQHYFSGLSLGIGTILLTTYFLFGCPPSNIGLLPMLLLYVPLLCWQAFISWWLQRYNVDPVNERGFLAHGIMLSIAVTPIYLLALIGVMRRKRLKFKVTQKGRAQQGHERSLRLFVPHLILGTLTGTAVVAGLAFHHDSAVLVFWGCLSAVLMYGIVARIALSRIRMRFALRRPTTPVGSPRNLGPVPAPALGSVMPFAAGPVRASTLTPIMPSAAVSSSLTLLSDSQ